MSRIFYIFAGIFLVGVLLALLWAARAQENLLQNLPDTVASEFAPLLSAPGSNQIRISDVEQKATQILRESDYVTDLLVRKVDEQGRSRTIYPFAYDLDHAEFTLDQDSGYEIRPVFSEQTRHVGDVYIRINTTRRKLYLAAIAGSIAAIIIVSILGFYTIQSQEQEVRKTTTLLEEKQRELIRLERLAIVGQVTANLIHDLKKPVLNIRAETESVSDKELKKCIQEETDLFLSMIRDLQLEGFVRKESEHAEFLDIHEIAERSMRLVKYAQQNVTVDLQFPDSLPFIFGHRHQLIQVFSNILLNAFQALEGEGTIRISATFLEEDEERLLEVSLTDDGPGIPYDILTHIFEPFYSTSPNTESTGLGLYITKSIVESMGGKITAHSIPKHGTTFTMHFPISPAEEV